MASLPPVGLLGFGTPLLANKKIKMVISIIVGLCVWFVLPIMFSSRFRKKKNKKAFAMFCKIVGIVIISFGIINHIIL